MRIDPKKRSDAASSSRTRSGGGASAQPLPAINPVAESFGQMLEKISYVEKRPQKPLHDRMAELLDAEDEFLHHRSVMAMHKYKAVVSDILARISQDSVAIDKYKVSKNKQLEVIRVIHEKLDFIAKGLTTSHSIDENGKASLVENHAFHMMKTMADIRGLIVSIYR